MAGHSKWKNIQRTKGANDLQRAKEFTKLVRAIEVAAQTGADPKLNPTLADAIEKAKKQNLPKEKIENAINKGAGNARDGKTLQKIIYEGYGPHNTLMLIECLTDNRNRSISEVRAYFGKNGGRIVETGAISWQFMQIGIIELDEKVSEEEILKIFELEGILDCFYNESQTKIICEPTKLQETKINLSNMGLNITDSYLAWQCNDEQEVDGGIKGEVENFIEKLEELDDVQTVWW